MKQVKQWYELLFENCGKKYDEESFTRDTGGECDFIEQKTCKSTFSAMTPGICPPGRHSTWRSCSAKGHSPLNGLFPLFHSVKDSHADTTDAGVAAYDGSTFDLMTFRDYNITTVEDNSGNIKKLTCRERYYVPPEITWLLKSLGFKTIDIYGARLDAFYSEDKLTTADFEMLIITQK